MNAAVNWGNSSLGDSLAFFFSDLGHVRYRLNGANPSSYVRHTPTIWRLPQHWTRVDAAINWGNSNWGDSIAYFFSGTEYVRYRLNSQTPETDARDTQTGWQFPASWGGRIDAAINWGNTTAGDSMAYFFSGTEYVRYRLNGSAPDTEARDTQSYWNFPPSWGGRIDAAINWGNSNWGDSVAYFFSGSEYVRYRLYDNAPDTEARNAQWYWNWNFPEGTSSETPNEVPKVFALQGSYPNPFNPVTNITFILPHSGATVVTVYDIQGRKVASQDLGIRSAGEHSVRFDMSRQSSGVYVYEVLFGTERRVGRIVLEK